ncbi:Uncharacterized protein Rs2_29119 [Raphanus sativus]|nr:Uncharacterized protein Rs2_29119 [Raphanus sativus]
MALDTASEGNFNTRNPIEAVRLIENLANSSSTKNTDSDKKKSVAAIGKDQMNEVIAKIDALHAFLGQPVCSAEEGEAREDDTEEDVNYTGATGFQRYGNQSGNRNFFGSGQKSKYNQSSQYQKPFPNTRNYGNSAYQNPPPPTQESTFDAMIDRVLEGQQKLTVDFNGKIDSVFNNLTTRIDTICTQVKKLETQIVQTEDSIRRIGTSKEVGEGSRKHHVNAIIDDDFLQVLKHEKVQEGDFEVESSLSFAGSQWCRSTPTSPHRSTSTMSFLDSTADCNAISTNETSHSSIDKKMRDVSIDPFLHLSIDTHLSHTECNYHR